MNNRIKNSLRNGVWGGLAGFIAERGLEYATGVDFIDGVMEIAGATLGVLAANRDLIQLAYDSAVQVTGKEPKDLSNAEWEEVRQKYPRAVGYLEQALAVR
ncbi:MAG TPA: hypothetical protein PKN04_01650 [bacterium]|jgi:hypothetical protein|nr:hypothetical protein [bacterium]HNT64463.1 hypothetical protein [bacterium]HOX84690.1 hypothetical protein [bacterium]HPG45413.1 hypothetical protein [bacterium]HPM96811.1 hypothetical protein [bacterium]